MHQSVKANYIRVEPDIIHITLTGDNMSNSNRHDDQVKETRTLLKWCVVIAIAIVVAVSVMH